MIAFQLLPYFPNAAATVTSFSPSVPHTESNQTGMQLHKQQQVWTAIFKWCVLGLNVSWIVLDKGTSYHSFVDAKQKRCLWPIFAVGKNQGVHRVHTVRKDLLCYLEWKIYVNAI